MKLPMPGAAFDVRREVEMVRQIEQGDRENHKKNRDVEIGQARLILTSPDGTRWSIEVDNAGTISASSI